MPQVQRWYGTKKKLSTALHKYGIQWDKSSRIFQLIFEKCPKSRDDMELKKIVPYCTFLKNDHKYGTKKNCPTAWCTVGQKKQNFSTHLKKCPKSRDDMELKKIIPLHTINMVCSGTKEVEFFNSFKKMPQVQRWYGTKNQLSHCRPQIWCAVG